ncbi:lipoxygenase 3, chloroplastic-like [Senna tora]|uniref:Lipoxygenase 3, chloroplastic-like n=1 Tax=Senna tora TaxID=362788 RepID=A0A834X8D2_9FABA|nr:lipoxygenase 3, chloroplastic-like [Senna tora]
MEPFIVAAHRQLSVMHPIFKLLKPHMKDTLQINALAREALINGGGIIESDFTSGKYSVPIVSAAYRDWWRFDMEALPADLIRRGLAEVDPTQPHGLKLLIEDYPYANDGLPIWFAIENWVRAYVTHYYQDEAMVQSDTELQAWYNEAIKVGHADHRHATWWPKLSTPTHLSSILTTLIWVASVQHSAVNFGQYPYGGYVPMRPPLMRRLLPKQGEAEYKDFMEDPEWYLLNSIPNLFQTTKFLAVVNLLSQHSTDEEYLGQRKDLSDWSGEPEIIEAFYRFSMEIRRIEKEIEKRNSDPNLRNRCGPGIPPYELLMASSSPGVTCRGVPNSISI